LEYCESIWAEYFGSLRSKGKSAISIARHFGGRQRNFTGEVFWARGYFVSTVGLDEEMVRAYIRNQELEDERYDQMKLGL
jgi:putative transposase